jgi:glutamate-1-semialdehyde 2,1-aminomutase
MAQVADTDRDGARLAELIEQQQAIFLARQTKSAAMLARAEKSLAGGGTSSWQIARPQMIWVSHGTGSKVYDVDGMEYVDMHGGYGVSLMGHGHPAVVKALNDRGPLGTHFAQPTEDAIWCGEELARRWRLPLWRFGNSGTEATMDAFHLMRAHTGRDYVIKIEGCYHGHHDSAMVSVANAVDEIGPADRPAQPAAGSGLPKAITDLTLIAPFNNLAYVEKLLTEYNGQVAGMILEPIMMNAGIIPPEDGYLQGLKDLLHARGALLAFDEVKTGLTVGPGGATVALGVTPDIVCLAKAIGGGIPCGAIGGTAEVMKTIADGDYDQVGTFNGNPLTMATVKATLETLDDAAYDHLDELRRIAVEGIEKLIAEYDIPAHVVAVGAKGAVTFATEEVRDYRGFLAIDDRFSNAHWLYQHNGGVFLPPWGKAEQWLFSVQHIAEDAQRLVDNFEAMARAFRA